MRAYMQPGFAKAIMRLAWTCFRADAETALKARLEGAEHDSTRRFLDWVVFAMPVAEGDRTYAQLVVNEIGDSLSPAERIEWERFSSPRWSVFETVRSVAGDATYVKDTATGEVLRVAVEVDPADVDLRLTVAGCLFQVARDAHVFADGAVTFDDDDDEPAEGPPPGPPEALAPAIENLVSGASLYWLEGIQTAEELEVVWERFRKTLVDTGMDIASFAQIARIIRATGDLDAAIELLPDDGWWSVTELQVVTSILLRIWAMSGGPGPDEEWLSSPRPDLGGATPAHVIAAERMQRGKAH
jgi:hypothetical protein